MIEVENLTKKFGKNIVVDNITLNIESNSINVLLGPNGAGKSTTIKSIAGLLNFKGKISICGYSNKSLEAKKIFGYVPETPFLYEILTIREHFKFISKAYRLDDNGLKLAYKYAEKLELTEYLDKLGRELSKGMQQKVSICMALMISPKVILFDEPMVGLDPKAIKNLNNIFIDLKKNGVSLFISTHIIDIVEEFWDNAYIMNKGKIALYLKRDQQESTKKLKDTFFDITEGGN
ncbi:MAG: ABC transporter ATP-binding protein [Clostridiales bacterium]